MSKNIIFCADGTWNSPDRDEDNDHHPDPTNVYKLFLLLDGEPSADSLRAADEQEKVLTENGEVVQIAKYIHGVGDTRNKIVKLMGGAFGAGLISRIVRGYTFVSRCYEPGDRIFLVGFSRGAYTARALAGFIAHQGLLAKTLTEDKEKAYRKGAAAWYRYRESAAPPDFFARLGEIAADLPAFFSHDSLKESDFVQISGKIAAVAVWDTVGAMGIPRFDKDDRRLDAFRFSDTKLSDKVERGFHLVSLDERRCDFTPTLWESRVGVKQALFPGAHADVGGGYPATGNQSGLSDLSLLWMVNELRAESVGVRFAEKSAYVPKGDAAGVAHQPWRDSFFKTETRAFSNPIIGHHSIATRAALADVQGDPKEEPGKYCPGNLPKEICNPDRSDKDRLCARCSQKPSK